MRQDLFVLCRVEAEIAEQAVIDALRKAVGVVAQLLRVRYIAQVSQFDQNRWHAGASQNIQAGVQPYAVILGAYAGDNAVQHVLGEPVSLRILLVDVDLTAVNSRVDVGIAVDTDKIIRGPAVRHIHASSQAAGVARAETLGRGIAAQPHGKARVGVQHVGQIHADRKVDVLLDRSWKSRPYNKSCLRVGRPRA